MVVSTRIGNSLVMYRRILAPVLWFIAAWETGAAIELLTDLQGGSIPLALAVIATLVAVVSQFISIYSPGPKTILE